MQITIPDKVILSIAGLDTGKEVILNDVAALTLFRYGCQRWLNDKTGGADQTPAERLKKADDAIARLLAGEIGTRDTLSDEERATRVILKSLLQETGLKAADAEKDAKRGLTDANVLRIARASIAKKLGIAAKDVTDDQAEEGAARIVGYIDAKVSALVLAERAARTTEDLPDII